jgi:N-acetylmuramoyl-L-alanine amidase
VTLERRNHLANHKGCDLFLSLHANAARREGARGLEIYTLNRASDEAARRLAERENQGSKGKHQDAEEILADLIQTAAAEEATDLAQFVKKSIHKKFGKKEVKVKSALFYVLVGAKCPSLLLETGFITNRREAGQLKDSKYQERLADAIAEGVARYLASEKDRRANL